MENELNNSMSPRDALPEWGERFGSIANVEDKTFWKLSSGNKVWEAANSISSFVPLSGDKRLSGDLSVYNANLYKEEQTDKSCIRVTGSEFVGGNVYINSYISAVQINFSAPLTAWLDTQLQNYQMGDCYETWPKLEVTDSSSSYPIATFNQSYSRSQYYGYWIRKDYYWSGSDGYITLTAWNEGNQSSNGSLVGVGRAIEISYSGGTFNVSYYIAASDYELTSSGFPYVSFYWSGDGTQTSITLTRDYNNYISPYYMDSSSNYWYGEEYKVDITVLSGVPNTLPYELSDFSYSLVIDPQYTDNDTYDWAYNIGTTTESGKIVLSSNSVTPFSISDGHVFTKYKSDEYGTNYYMSEFFGEHKLSDLQISIYDNGSDYSINGTNANYDQQYDYGNPNFYNYSTSDTTKNVHTIEKYATESIIDEVNSKITSLSSNVSTVENTVSTNAAKSKNTFYGTSNSASTNLTASVTGWNSTTNSRVVGNVFYIKFTNSSVMSYAPTNLNINNSGNVGIRKRQSQNSVNLASCSKGDIKIAAIYEFVYDGQYYILLNPNENETFYGTCYTNTAAGTVATSGKFYQTYIEAGNTYNIYFSGTTISSVALTALNINGMGNKNVYKWDTGTNSNVQLVSGDIQPYSRHQFVYDGTYFRMVPTFDGSKYLPLKEGGTISGDLKIYSNELSTNIFDIHGEYDRMRIGYDSKAAAAGMGPGAMAIGISANAFGARVLAVGYDSYAGASAGTGNGNTAIGAKSKALKTQSTAIGREAYASETYTTAIGSATSATASYAIQLGRGTNNTVSSLQVYDWQLLDSNGDIPYERLSTSIDPILGNILSTLQVINGTNTSSSEAYSGFIPISDPLYYKVTKDGTSVSRQIQGPPLSWFQTTTSTEASYSDNGTFKFSFDGNGHIIVTVDSNIDSIYDGTAPYSVGDTVATIDQTTLVPTSTNGTFEWIESL